MRRALDSASPGAQERTRALILCGWFEASGGNLDQARTDLEEAIALGDEAGAATARLHLAFIHTQGGRALDALSVLDKCRPQLARHGLTWEVGTSWLLAAWAHITEGDFAAGEDACRRALAVLQPLGDAWALAHAEGLLGELALGRQQFPEAVAHLTKAAHSAGALGFEAAQAHHLLNLGRAELQSGEPVSARATLEQAINLADGCGDARTAASARTHLAQLLRDSGDTTAAWTLAERAARWFDAAGGGDGAAHATELLAGLRSDITT